MDEEAVANNFSDQSEGEIEDPRTLKDIEQENTVLKEQLATQLLSVEQYLGVANLWLLEKYDNKNTFDLAHSQKVQITMEDIQTTMADEHPQAVSVFSKYISTHNEASAPTLPTIWHNYPNQSALDYKAEHPVSVYSSLKIDENSCRDDQSQLHSKKSQVSRRSHQSASIPDKVSLAGIKIKELFFKKH